MVEAHRVREPEIEADPLDPPVVSLVGEDVPAVEGMAPELAIRAEVVRRNARNRSGPPVLPEGEQPAVRPDVGAVPRDVDGHVPEDRDAARVRGGLDPLPLPEEEELSVGVEGDLLFELGPRRAEGSLLATREGWIPLDPGPRLVLLAKGGEKRPIREPCGLRRGVREARDLFGDPSADRARVAKRVFEEPPAERHGTLPVDA